MSEVDPALQMVGIEIAVAALLAVFVLALPDLPKRRKKKGPK